MVRVLFVALSSAGHINPLLGLASALSRTNNDIVFATERSWKGKFVKHGFKEEIYDESDNSRELPGMHFAELVQKMSRTFRLDPHDTISSEPYYKFLDGIQYSNSQIAEIIAKTKPDVIVYVHRLWYPAVLTAKIPVVLLEAAHPLYGLSCDTLPPPASGLALDSDPQLWKKFTQKKKTEFGDFLEKYSEYLQSMGAPPPTHFLGYHSSNLNILMYPKLLAKDYFDRSSNSDGWITIDHAIRPSDGQFELPEAFKTKPGRLVYLSMGTFGSYDVSLMNTLVDYLGKASPKYKIVVSKGLSGKEYELAENMWGQDYLPQIDVLPLVDLAVIHGGNNSFVETLYFGKPMIVVPLFADQPDNAQRAVDVKIGARFNPFRQTGDELIQLMDKVLDDAEILRNVSKLSEDMQKSSALEEAAEQIIFVAKNPKFPFFK